MIYVIGAVAALIAFTSIFIVTGNNPSLFIGGLVCAALPSFVVYSIMADRARAGDRAIDYVAQMRKMSVEIAKKELSDVLIILARNRGDEAGETDATILSARSDREIASLKDQETGGPDHRTKIPNLWGE